MKISKHKILLICGLVAFLTATTLLAVQENTKNPTDKSRGKGKVERGITDSKEEEEAVLGSTSSRRITTRATRKQSGYVDVRQLTANLHDDRFPFWSPDGQEIVFQVEDSSYNHYGIWKINVDGTGLTPLALPDTTVYLWMCFNRPSYSPDGSKIAYRSYGDTTHGGFIHASIFVMDSDGSNRQRVSLDTSSSCYARVVPNWSPDGERIVCENNDFTEELCIINLVDSTETDVGALTLDSIGLECVKKGAHPRFSPDGSKILFKDDDFYVNVIDTSGANHIVIDTVNYMKQFAWSPDGNQLVYNNDRDYSSYNDLWIADADGSGKIPLFEDTLLCFLEPNWQPSGAKSDGRWIVYTQTPDQEWQQRSIWVVSTDGLYCGELWADPADSTYYLLRPRWSPQGDKIVFSAGYSGVTDIFVIDLDTLDNDLDNLLNWEEYAAYGTDPDDRDTDRGDECDGFEIANGRDPLDPADDLGTAPPYTDGHDPAPGDSSVSPTAPIIVHVKDNCAGVDSASTAMTVEGSPVTPLITGGPYDFTLTYYPPVPYDSGQTVEVTVDASDRAVSPNVMPQDVYSFAIIMVGIEEETVDDRVPTEFNLSQNAPNPVLDKTAIAFQVPHTANVTLRIYDASGRLVRTLVDESRGRGYYSVNWNRRDSSGQIVSSGVYLYEIKAGEYRSTKKMVVE